MASKTTFSFSLLVALLVIASAPCAYSEIVQYRAFIIDELVEPLNITCNINGQNLGLVSLKQSKVYKPTINVDTSKTDDVVLTCNLNAGDRCGQFILFGYHRDGVRCDKRTCYWNLESDALYLFLNNKQVLYYLWSHEGCR
ncbi:hypothetical protein ACH5RR_032791 [Cinchona calisaya]|uniref:S-protein homolog n=1 Tax=Cinchona calisaya TaxID=153742 RepID=A0ABD2YLJ2_9GENT